MGPYYVPLGDAPDGTRISHWHLRPLGSVYPPGAEMRARMQEAASNTHDVLALAAPWSTPVKSAPRATSQPQSAPGGHCRSDNPPGETPTPGAAGQAAQRPLWRHWHAAQTWIRQKTRLRWRHRTARLPTLR